MTQSVIGKVYCSKQKKELLLSNKWLEKYYTQKEMTFIDHMTTIVTKPMKRDQSYEERWTPCIQIQRSDRRETIELGEKPGKTTQFAF